MTFNEEENLPRCLQAISWCDDVVVVDSGSLDRTVEIASAAGVRVYTRPFDSFAGQRNWALDELTFRHEWILHLDADEVCSASLVAEIAAGIQDSPFDAYRVPSKMMFMGKWLRFAAMYPSYQVRLGRHPVFRFKQVGHGQREDLDAVRVGTLKEPYLHYSFSKGLQEWFAKHNRYSSDEAREAAANEESGRLDLRGLLSLNTTRRRRSLKLLSFRLPFRPLVRFAYMYFVRLGMLDGLAGFRYCILMSIYEWMIDMKSRELRQRAQGRSV